MEDIFSFKIILKPNTSLFESLLLFSSEIFFWHVFIDFALRDFCTFKKLSPSVCIFNLTSTTGKISVIICLQVNNFFHFLGNLNYYHLPDKYIFSTSGKFVSTPGKSLPGIPFSTSWELISTSWEISIITFYQVNTLFPLQGNSFPLPGKSQLLPSTR